MPDPILVQREEDVADVLGRLRALSGGEVRLVVPSGSALAESRFNFQLLAVQAEETGQHLVVESDDERVLELAAGAGLATPGFGGRGVAPAATSGAAVPPFEEIEEYGGDEWEEEEEGAGPGYSGPGQPGYQPGSGPWRPEALTSTTGRGRRRRLLLYAAAAAILLIGIAAVVILVPSATITITTSSQAFSTPVDLTAQPGSQSGPITVRSQAVQKRLSGTFQATGARDTPGAKASGTIQYHDTCSPAGLQVNQGAVLTAKSGAAFVQQKTVTVAANQTATAPIQAQAEGSKSNVAAGQITTLQNAGVYESCLKVTNPQPTTGGKDAKHQTLVTQQDLNRAQAQLQQQAEQSIQSQLGADVRQGERQSDQNPVLFGSPDFTADHPAGSAVQRFDATLTLKGTSAYYRPAQVSSAFRAALQARVPAGRQLTPDDFVAQYQTAAGGGGQLEFKGQASGRIAPKLDLGAIRKRLAGRSLGSAQSYLRGLPVSNASITEYPFSLPLLPLLSSRISIDYVIQQPPAPSPSPSPGAPPGGVH